MNKRLINLLNILFAVILAIVMTSWLNLTFNNYAISPISVVYFVVGLVGFNYLIHKLLAIRSQQWLLLATSAVVTVIEELMGILVNLSQINTFSFPDVKSIIIILLINMIIIFQYQKNDLFKIVVALIMSFFETIAICFNFDVGETLWSWVLVVGSINLLINLVSLKYVRKRSYWLLSSIAGILFSLALVLGKQLYDNYQFPAFNVATILTFMGFVLFWTAIVALIINYVINTQNVFSSNQQNSPIQNWFNQLKHPWLWSAVVTFIIFIPAIIALAPGIWSYDTPYQYFSMTRNNWNMGQPIASMMIVYFFVQIIGVNFLHSVATGLFIMIVVQFILAAVIFGYGFKVLNRWQLPWILQVVVWSWWTLHITNWTSLAQSNTKDTWCGLAAVLIMIFLLEMWQDGPKFFHSYGKLVLLILSLFVFLTFRNSSRLVLIMFLPFWLGVCWKYWKQIVAIIVATGALFYLFNGPVVHSLPSSAVDVNQGGGVRNMDNVGGLKAQIIFGGYVNAGNKFSLADKQLLWTILPKGTPEQYSHFYSPQFADQANTVWGQLGVHYHHIYQGNYNQRRSKMMKQIISHYPLATLQVILNQNLGWYYPQSTYPSKSGNIYNEVINETKNGPMKKDGVIINNWKLFPSLYQLIYGLEQDGTYYQYPVIASFFDPAFWGWIILVVLLILIAQKSWKALTISFFMTIQWATLWAAPVVLVRYIYPVFLCLPLLAIMIYIRKSKLDVIE
ncbi:hypothetical protein DS832_04415 [Bombilactobacillus bombi]|uniref:Uncharacterized protein n=1 Tax=Bombilactobacillus bombi TaxID=1303590 RepID=A0A3R6YPR9_9LACO|nr:hypothetical protein [Bombilactobacillus bombi]RHW47394.1 hypothetical protein DS832_04415 [Bombilactobacillus bombi]